MNEREEEVFFVFIRFSSCECCYPVFYNKTIACLRSLFACCGWNCRGRGSTACLSLGFARLGDGSFTESVAESTKDDFQVFHATGAGGFSATSLVTPLKAACLGRGKSTGSATLLLQVVR